MGASTESANVKLFISSVSAELGSYRIHLRNSLTRQDVEVKVQEDFITTGYKTLEMLDNYIQVCDGVIHLVGDMSGSMASASSAAAMQKRYPNLATRLPALSEFLAAEGRSLPYTQWEAWLALWHGKKLFIATASAEAPRDSDYLLDPVQRSLQQTHLNRLKTEGWYSSVAFSGPDNLAAVVLKSFVLDLLGTKKLDTSTCSAAILCHEGTALIGIDNAKASEHLNQAIRADDTLFGPRISLATIEIVLGNFKTALSYLEQASLCQLQHYPEDINSQARIRKLISDVENQISNRRKRWLPF
jgi:tetratricopeptide (TPR) repeat protein